MSLTNLLQMLSMGCVCGKETVNVAGRQFCIRSRLGEGGFSYVDLVEERPDRKLYALKRLTCHSTDDEKAAMMEVDYMNSLDHVGIIPCVCHEKLAIHGHVSAISEVLIVMPFYKNGSLQDECEFLRKRGERMEERRILKLLRQVCEGLRFLHHYTPSLAHRDVKPANVMLEVDDTPVLMDLGSMGPGKVEIKGSSEARAMQDLAAERCTMPYRAPELFNVESYCTIDEKIDIWSLGCTLYAMCFYESPFDQTYQRGDSIALAVLAGNVKIPENSKYSQKLTDLILSLLVVNATERPDIDWVIQKVDTLIGTLENRV